MKTRTFLLLVILTVGFGNVYSQNDSTPKTTFLKQLINKGNLQFHIKTDILLPILSIMDEGSEYAIYAELGALKKYSIQVGGSTAHSQTTEKQESSLQISGELKFFFTTREQYTGFYLGPYVKITGDSYLKETGAESTQSYSMLQYTQNSIGAGLNIGYQNYILKRIVVDFSAGGGFRQIADTKIIKMVNTELNQKQTTPDYWIRLLVGYKF